MKTASIIACVARALIMSPPRQGVEIARGNELRIDGEGKVARLDYVQLNRPGARIHFPAIQGDAAGFGRMRRFEQVASQRPSFSKT